MLLPFFQWCETVWLGRFVVESNWLFPVIESVHLLALCLFVGLAIVLDLRLLGRLLRGVPVSQVADRLLPWTTGGFAVMVITGSLLFYAIPIRTYQSVWFRGKVIFLILAGLNVWIFHSGVYKRVTGWDMDERTPWPARRAAIASLVLWALIIVFGRFIAYNWFDCDIQPQSAFVNWFAGCVVPPAQ